MSDLQKDILERLNRRPPLAKEAPSNASFVQTNTIVDANGDPVEARYLSNRPLLPGAPVASWIADNGDRFYTAKPIDPPPSGETITRQLEIQYIAAVRGIETAADWFEVAGIKDTYLYLQLTNTYIELGTVPGIAWRASGEPILTRTYYPQTISRGLSGFQYTGRDYTTNTGSGASAGILTMGDGDNPHGWKFHTKQSLVYDVAGSGTPNPGEITDSIESSIRIIRVHFIDKTPVGSAFQGDHINLQTRFVVNNSPDPIPIFRINGILFYCEETKKFSNYVEFYGVTPATSLGGGEVTITYPNDRANPVNWSTGSLSVDYTNNGTLKPWEQILSVLTTADGQSVDGWEATYLGLISKFNFSGNVSCTVNDTRAIGEGIQQLEVFASFGVNNSYSIYNIVGSPGDTNVSVTVAFTSTRALFVGDCLTDLVPGGEQILPANIYTVTARSPRVGNTQAITISPPLVSGGFAVSGMVYAGVLPPSLTNPIVYSFSDYPNFLARVEADAVGTRSDSVSGTGRYAQSPVFRFGAGVRKNDSVSVSANVTNLQLGHKRRVVSWTFTNESEWIAWVKVTELHQYLIKTDRPTPDTNPAGGAMTINIIGEYTQPDVGSTFQCTLTTRYNLPIGTTFICSHNDTNANINPRKKVVWRVMARDGIYYTFKNMGVQQLYNYLNEEGDIKLEIDTCYDGATILQGDPLTDWNTFATFPSLEPGEPIKGLIVADGTNFTITRTSGAMVTTTAEAWKYLVGFRGTHTGTIVERRVYARKENVQAGTYTYGNVIRTQNIEDFPLFDEMQALIADSPTDELADFFENSKTPLLGWDRTEDPTIYNESTMQDDIDYFGLEQLLENTNTIVDGEKLTFSPKERIFFTRNEEDPGNSNLVTVDRTIVFNRTINNENPLDLPPGLGVSAAFSASFWGKIVYYRQEI